MWGQKGLEFSFWHHPICPGWWQLFRIPGALKSSVCENHKVCMPQWAPNSKCVWSLVSTESIKGRAKAKTEIILWGQLLTLNTSISTLNINDKTAILDYGWPFRMCCALYKLWFLAIVLNKLSPCFWSVTSDASILLLSKHLSDPGISAVGKNVPPALSPVPFSGHFCLIVFTRYNGEFICQLDWATNLVKHYSEVFV